MFRAGLEFVCPNCQLAFWVSLDSAKALLLCEYCETEFNAVPLLRDRDWRYRRSGLFGRDDHQAGGIPVALTLQQLDANLRGKMLAWTTSMNLDPAGTEIDKCETDFVLLTQSYDGQIQIVIGECKSAGGEISAADVEHLTKVANAFEGSPIEPFLVFSKLSDFTTAEIEDCRLAQAKERKRAVLLSRHELEPYHIYERFKKSPPLRGSTLEDLAEATERLYFRNI